MYIYREREKRQLQEFTLRLLRSSVAVVDRFHMALFSAHEKTLRSDSNVVGDHALLTVGAGQLMLSRTKP